MGKQKDITEIKQLIRRRGKTFLIVFLSILLPACLIAFILPPVYVSTSKILIEAQQIPPEYIPNSGSSYVEERLSAITQRIMSRDKLLEIINKLNLYPEMRKSSNKEAVVEQMRQHIYLTTIGTGDLGKDSRRAAKAKGSTVAFTLSYDGSDPAKVQKVADVLTSLYLEENLKKRGERAAGTVEFLNKQLEEIKKQVDGYASKLTALKSSHVGELPEQSATNLQAIERLNSDLNQVNAQLRTAQERKVYLENQLASVDKFLPDRSAKETELPPSDRLNLLRNELISRQTTLTDMHPDIIRLKREIRELEKQLASGNNISGGHKIVNPAYTNIKAQLETAAMEIRSLHQQSGQIRSQMNMYQGKLNRSPIIETEYKNVLGDYENAKNKYNDTMNKLMEAKAAQGMEESQHAERFTLIEAAAFPEQPDSPNRPKIILIGLFLALFGGIALITTQESLDRSIKTADDLNALVKAPVLSVIPYYEGREKGEKGTGPKNVVLRLFNFRSKISDRFVSKPAGGVADPAARGTSSFSVLRQR